VRSEGRGVRRDKETYRSWGDRAAVLVQDLQATPRSDDARLTHPVVVVGSGILERAIRLLVAENRGCGPITFGSCA